MTSLDAKQNSVLSKSGVPIAQRWGFKAGSSNYYGIESSHGLGPFLPPGPLPPTVTINNTISVWGTFAGESLREYFEEESEEGIGLEVHLALGNNPAPSLREKWPLKGWGVRTGHSVIEKGPSSQ